MRTPAPTLIRDRAKGPLPDLVALHLSNAGLECVKYLDDCAVLRSLYLNDNRLADLTGITQLRNLWRLDLSGNGLTMIEPLASFRALGFLWLEHNQLTFDALLCLRGLHVLDLRLAGNPHLLEDGAPQQRYHKKVVAILPNAWTLNGHYVSALERQQAQTEFASFELASISTSRGASQSSALWSCNGSNTFSFAHEQPNVAKMLDAIQEQPERQLLQDLSRLRYIVMFHNEEAVVHNTHAQFAPSKRASDACLMPLIRVDEVNCLPRSIRLAVVVLLTAYLRFRFNKRLLTEALTIQLLELPWFSGQAIEETANLPQYALVALTCSTRQRAIEEEDAMRHAAHPDVSTGEFERDSELWRSLPVVSTTLFDDDQVNTPEDGNASRITVWCLHAVRLLSNTASFPDTTRLGRNKASASVFRSLLPLFRAAEWLSPTGSPFTGPTGCVTVSILTAQEQSKSWKRGQTLDRAYPRPWAADTKLDKARYVLRQSHSEPTIDSGDTVPRKPRLGEWIQLRPKHFLKIMHAPDDGDYVVAAPAAQPSATVPIDLDQMIRVSSSMWRLAPDFNLDLETSASTFGLATSRSSHSLTGKLHRDNGGFHRHGAARNQGFPNLDVPMDMVQEAGFCDALTYADPLAVRRVELFASNDTLDANYVLAPPLAVAAQNYCAGRVFAARQQAPAGLWSPIKQPAPFAHTDEVSAPVVQVQSSPQQSDVVVPTPQAAPPSAVDDDWAAIKTEMQALLGIKSRSPRTPSDPIDSGDSDAASELPPTSSAVTRHAAVPRLNVLPPSRTPPIRWHALPTKTTFLVASPSPALGGRGGPSLAPPAMAATSTVAAAANAAAAAAATGTLGLRGSSRQQLKLRNSNQSLPSLSSIQLQK